MPLHINPLSGNRNIFISRFEIYLSDIELVFEVQVTDSKKGFNGKHISI